MSVGCESHCCVFYTEWEISSTILPFILRSHLDLTNCMADEVTGLTDNSSTRKVDCPSSGASPDRVCILGTLSSAADVTGSAIRQPYGPSQRPQGVQLVVPTR